MNPYLDTNAVVKRYHKEKGTEYLMDWMNIFADDLIVCISEYQQN